MITLDNVDFSYSQGPAILQNISFSLEEKERVGLVAPSGYGKTTLAKILAGRLKPQSGNIEYGKITFPLQGPHPIQLIPQHPENAFNPRWKMKKIEKELGKELPKELMESLQIKKEWLNRFPHELSGGELQRFSIARTLSLQPQYLIADEISTMLDVVTQAQIWHFILNYVKEHEIGLLVMSHNPELLKVTCTREINLMKLNKRPVLQPIL